MAHKLASSAASIETFIERAIEAQLASLKPEQRSEIRRDKKHPSAMPPARHDETSEFPNDIRYREESGSAGQPIPRATLVYHESAHSIVFRDHLRRQLGACRRQTYDLVSSIHSVQTQYENRGRHGLRSSVPINEPNNLNIHNDTTTYNLRSSAPGSSIHDSSDGGAGSTETSSEKGYVPSDGSGYESAGSRDSHGTASDRSSSRGGHGRGNSEQPPPQRMRKERRPVSVANFQPVIEPLRRLELNADDVFQPLLDADPVLDLNGGESGLSEAEIEGRSRFCFSPLPVFCCISNTLTFFYQSSNYCETNKLS